MQKLNATINFGGGLANVNANIPTTAENLVPALRLAVEILREPAFPESDFDQIRKQRIAKRSAPIDSTGIAPSLLEPGYIVVDGTSDVSIDGIKIGRAPFRYEISPGRHQVALHLAGGVDERRVLVESRRAVRVTP